MDILQVSPRYSPSTGGIQNHVRNLSQRLVENGHSVTVLTSHNPSDVPRTEKNEGVSLIRVPAFTSYLLSPSVTRFVRNVNFDIVHVHGYHSLTSLCGIVGSADENLVFTPHYIGEHGSSWRQLLLRLYRPFGRYTVRKPAAVIAVSEWEQKKLSRLFGVDPVMIPNGIDVDRFRQETPYQCDEYPTDSYVFSLGRLVEYKGHQHLVRAIEHTDLDLVVAGDGPYRRTLEELTEAKGVADRVHFLGYVEDECIPSLYAGAAVHATLSEYECFGLTVGESLAAGTPCVVRETTALSEWVEVPGCLSVEDVTPESVAEALERARSKTAQPDQLFTWDEMTEDIEKMYESVVE